MSELLIESFVFGFLLNPYTIVAFWANLFALLFIKFKLRKHH